MDPEQKCYNILLLGQTGVGKSTFINAFANYLTFQNLEAALQGELACIIPAKFIITNDQHQQIPISFDFDENEDKIFGNSSTQGTKAYQFPIQNQLLVRVIDTPGMGDARGAEKDRENLQNILSYLATSIDYLHAICFLFKPNVTVIDPYFKFCVMELLSHLDRSACNNIMFLFTNSRGSDYKPGDTLFNIQSILDQIKDQTHVTIPLQYSADVQSNNVFCFDNEGFKYLVAHGKGHVFGNKSVMAESWERSSEASWQLILNIIGSEERQPITPHLVQKTVSLNNARKHIINLSKPLADCTELIDDNIEALRLHKRKVLDTNITIEELTNQLYIPIIDINEKVLPTPVTVCTANKCSEIVTVLGVTRHHYKQRCHNPCNLQKVPVKIIGSPELVNCTAMGGTQTCNICGCNFATHMHIYYETEVIESKAVDESIKNLLASNEDTREAQYQFIKKLEESAESYKKEHAIISEAMAMFANFLKTNSICPINDSYEEYLEYLIQRARHDNGNPDHVKRYTKLKLEHVEQKKVIENALKNATQGAAVNIDNAEDVEKIIQTLYDLPLMGKKIKSLHGCVDAATAKECKQSDYTHTVVGKNHGKRNRLNTALSEAVNSVVHSSRNVYNRSCDMFQNSRDYLNRGYGVLRRNMSQMRMNVASTPKPENGTEAVKPKEP